jgi:hypothetical protein
MGYGVPFASDATKAVKERTGAGINFDQSAAGFFKACTRYHQRSRRHSHLRAITRPRVEPGISRAPRDKHLIQIAFLAPH